MMYHRALRFVPVATGRMARPVHQRTLHFCVLATSVGHQRAALAESRRFHGDHGDREKPVQVEFTLPDGEVKTVTGYEGQTLLDVCAEQGLPMEGACGGSCACSTCHVYLQEKAMDLFEEATDEENDMIDQAFYPEPTSRLGCQLRLKKGVHDGLKVKMPRATRNMYVDGAKVVPH
ncbi:putative mitochondrial electron transfer protein [Leptomonas pyrrhocoris]|uniref:Putative mitochondrial electron transfer protein n=1 Tax=Leptomonas pyrrhocoris TaxID=157538 RepID=A0A0N0E0U5_LEPPY|nr:putative mitochondrial electron transfer protein [Leptomonas pyrrhocoris]XP_015665290.1 putative mitochondrial electron transfer protein [Leptomonas pyrrhocoris]KPA86850.1 putative mitochondrial electron transfer protein [Leptomonas pyrrhocoris]KPA86851.1 putative mitochondrial electron transfer protein [Leptomonas pyrrhocoris]|eukprot:XP_015665289.1 putative mitochondrial electron transfer protein [Leptomonas pyrrhocoris]